MMLKRASIAGALMLAVLSGCGEGTTEPPADTRHLFRYVPHSTTEAITSVSVAGSFTDWNPATRQMTRLADGTWEIRVDVPGGTHQYKYVFNGDQWAGNMCADQRWGNPPGGAVDPEATVCEDDGFGGQNAVLVR
jgi:cyclomaltodextrinase / maltogenic alpha-amylase / neopullulanase